MDEDIDIHEWCYKIIYNIAELLAYKRAIEEVSQAAATDPAHPLIHILPITARRPEKEGIKQVGIFPASFNPLTLAHIELVKSATAIFGLDEIILVLDIRNIDKEIITGAALEDRLLMLKIYYSFKSGYRIGLASHGLFLDKLRALKNIYPDQTTFNFIVGYDTIVRVLDKKYYQDREKALDELFSRSRFLVANRDYKGKREIEELLSQEENQPFCDQILPFSIANHLATISSTKIREGVKSGKLLTEFSHWIPEEIIFFIQETGLYHPPTLIRSGDKEIMIGRYDIRTRIINHLFALNPLLNQEIDLRKLIMTALTDNPLGQGMRRMLTIPPHSLPPRSATAQPRGVELVGNFCYQKGRFSLEQAQIEAQRCLQCPSAPCEQACLENIPIRYLLEMVAQGRVQEAAQYLRQTHHLAGITEYLCQTEENYCEAHCNLTTLLGSRNGVAIQEVLKTLWYYSRFTPSPPTSNPVTHLPKIAIVGSGPAGLAASLELAAKGYRVHIYEKKDKLGGIPRYEIPPFRFPANQILTEIEEKLRAFSIEIFTQIEIGTKIHLEDLWSDGYQAVFLATGLVKPVRLNIPGEELSQVMTSVELFSLYYKYGMRIMDRFRNKRVIVTDGGNTAMDTSRFLLRLGAEPIIIHWRDWPRALPKETAAAQREGVKFLHLCRPIRFLGDSEGNLRGVLISRTEYDAQTQQDRLIPGSEFIIPADYVVHAIGSLPDFFYPGLHHDPEGHVIVDPETLATSLEGIFAGGDLRAKGNISTAIRDGKKAAHSIATYLS
jgi:glutamate synthase (NADPH/NADH) small chain